MKLLVLAVNTGDYFNPLLTPYFYIVSVDVVLTLPGMDHKFWNYIQLFGCG